MFYLSPYRPDNTVTTVVHSLIELCGICIKAVFVLNTFFVVKIIDVLSGNLLLW